MFSCTPHALLTGATHSSSQQTTFFRPYLPNVGIKYLEVEKLLLNNTGAISKSIYNSKYLNVMVLIRELFCSWNHCHTAAEFIQGFLLKVRSWLSRCVFVVLFFMHYHVTISGNSLMR